MTTKQTNVVKSKIRKSLNFWIRSLGLQNWRRIDVVFVEDLSDYPDDRATVAESFTDWEYKHATVRFFVLRLEESSDENLDYFVRHELMHLLVNPMKAAPQTDATRKCEEFVVTSLAQAVQQVLEAGKRAKK